MDFHNLPWLWLFAEVEPLVLRLSQAKISPSITFTLGWRAYALRLGPHRRFLQRAEQFHLETKWAETKNHCLLWFLKVKDRDLEWSRKVLIIFVTWRGPPIFTSCRQLWLVNKHWPSQTQSSPWMERLLTYGDDGLKFNAVLKRKCLLWNCKFIQKIVFGRKLTFLH